MSISSHTFAPRLLAGFGTAALVAGIGLFASSRPAHTAGGPIPVTVSNSPLYAVTQSSDDPARQPVSVTVEFLESKTSTEFYQTLYTVPAGKRLVIDYASAAPFGTADANSYSFNVTAIQNGESQHANFNELPDSAPSSAVSQKVQLFADPGTPVVVTVKTSGKNATDLFFTLTGHLVDVS